MNKTMYRIINKSYNMAMTLPTAAAVGAYMLGRRLDNYIVIKSSDSGDRIVVFTDYEYNAIVSAMETA
jgi:hypothetical protein